MLPQSSCQVALFFASHGLCSESRLLLLALDFLLLCPESEIVKCTAALLDRLTCFGSDDDRGSQCD